MLSQSEIRAKILEIRNNANLSVDEKNVLSQLLFRKKSNIEPMISNYSNNCEHYTKYCSIFYFNCCNTTHPCVRCHNSTDQCHVDKPSITSITCMECYLKQEPSNICIGCNIQFARSFCNECKIWTQKNITHCGSCGICRVGKKEEIRHCDTCNICYSKTNIKDHTCFKYDYKKELCSLCCESLFSSQKKSQVLKCGHNLHSECIQNMLGQNQYKCPICKKSICDMKNYWVLIKNSILLQPIPYDLFPLNLNDIVISPYGKFKINEKIIQYDKCFYSGDLIDCILSNGTFTHAILLESCLKKDLGREIYCNDCHSKSIQQFHFLGLECLHCGSFNTQI
jgi:RING finger/CHY zinc finger protein 1